MDRRAFLSTLIGAGLTAAIDPERLLWSPGQKTIFIPPMIKPGKSVEFYRYTMLDWAVEPINWTAAVQYDAARDFYSVSMVELLSH